MMLASLKSSPPSNLVKTISKDAVKVDKFDTTIQAIEVKPMDGSKSIIGNYFDDMMVQSDSIVTDDDVRGGVKEITLNS